MGNCLEARPIKRQPRFILYFDESFLKRDREIASGAGGSQTGVQSRDADALDADGVVAFLVREQAAFLLP